MIAKSRIAAAMLFAALSAPALAADPAQSAMAGDPNWPAVGQVASSVTLQQSVGAPSLTEADPTWSTVRAVPAAIALHQAPLVDDPLQGHALTEAARYSSAAAKSATQVACTHSCACEHG